MSRILRTKYDNSRCKACNTSIPFGTEVRHTGGYGVTCLSCPHAPDLAAGAAQPQQSGTLASELLTRTERERDEARREVARLNEALAVARQTYREQRAEIAALRETVTSLQAKIGAPICGDCGQTVTNCRAGVYDGCTPAESVNPDEINVLAPGGVEAWLDAELKQRQAQAPEPCDDPSLTEDNDDPGVPWNQPEDFVDDDCPI